MDARRHRRSARAAVAARARICGQSPVSSQVLGSRSGPGDSVGGSGHEVLCAGKPGEPRGALLIPLRAADCIEAAVHCKPVTQVPCRLPRRHDSVTATCHERRSIWRMALLCGTPPDRGYLRKGPRGGDPDSAGAPLDGRDRGHDLSRSSCARGPGARGSLPRPHVEPRPAAQPVCEAIRSRRAAGVEVGPWSAGRPGRPHGGGAQVLARLRTARTNWVPNLGPRSSRRQPPPDRGRPSLHVSEPVGAPPWLDSCAPCRLPCNGSCGGPMCQPAPRAEGSPCRNLPTGAGVLALGSLLGHGCSATSSSSWRHRRSGCCSSGLTWIEEVGR